MKKIRVSVLIIGGGPAGISCALNLKTKDFALVELPQSSTASSVWNIGLSKTNADFERKITTVGHLMGNPSVIKKFVSLHRQTISDLESFGIPFRKSNIGKIPKNMSGSQIFNVLQSEMHKLNGLRINGQVDKFLKNKKTGRLIGVSVRSKNKRTDVYFNYCVIAGGGITRFYEYSTNQNNTNGSLLALAADAGLELQNIEFSMFHPFLITDKRFKRVLFSGTLLTKMKFVDKNGREFLSSKIINALKNNEHHSVFPQMTREFYVQSLKGKIFAVLECSEAWFEDYKKNNEYGFIFKKYKASDMGRLEIHPAFHFLIGGISINEKAETSENNVYAAGEICGGLYGANRFGGTAVSEAWVFGKVAAREINKKISQNRNMNHNTEFPKVDRIGSLGVRKNIKKLAWETLGPVRNKGDLEFFIKFLGQYKLSSEEKLIKNMALISLKRKASVGSFFRDDLQEKSYDKNSHCVNGMIVFKNINLN